MAKYYNAGTINASGSWNTIAETSSSYNDSEATTTALTTSYVASSNFTPGAVTVTHIGVKLSVRTGTTGTMSVNLRNTTAGADVAGTDVTINTADLPVAATADLNGGWHFFKLSSPVLLLAATNYAVQAKTSSSSQISLFSTATSNWARAIVTNATATPTTGDDMIVAGEYTGAGTSNSFTVTWNITAATDYGSTPTAANSLLTPGLAICNKGTLLVGTTAATTYQMKMSNSIIVYSGGIFSEASVATPMPRDSSFTGTLDCGVNVDYGILCRNLGTWIRQGQSRTSGKLFDKTLLNTDEAANSTSLGVADDTGWLDNDLIAVASTTRTNTQCEQGTLNGNASSTTLTVDGFAGTGGGVLNAHSGTSPTQAEVILLTRNITWQGASSSLQGYVLIGATAIVDFDWCALRYMGSNTTNKRGFETGCTTGTQTYDYISHYDFVVSGSRGFSHTGTSGTGLTVNDYVSYNVAQEHFVNVANSGSSVLNDFCGILNTTSNTQIYVFGDMGSTMTNITAAGCIQIGISLNESAAYGTISNIVTHSHANAGILWSNGGYGTINVLKSWRNITNGVAFSTQVTNSLFEVTINDLLAFGNGNQNIRCGYGKVILNDAIVAGDTTFSTASGISNQGNAANALFELNNCSFGPTSGIFVAHSSSDFALSGCQYVQIDMENTTLTASTEIATQTGLPVSGYITSMKHDGVSGANKTWKRQGTITIETTTVPSGETTSVKLTPLISTEKLKSTGKNGGMKVKVLSGQAVTFNCEVYEDASYNGARARLVVMRNEALGITADTVLDTATASSDLAWEALTGTTTTVTEDGTLQFYIDCDGTAGNLFYGKVTASVA
jgi:hypothetical protein